MGCTFPPGDQAAAVTAYRKDPAFSLTPPNGRLLKEASKTRAVTTGYPRNRKNRQDRSSNRLAPIQRDRAYTVDELVALVGPDVEAAGWQYQVVTPAYQPAVLQDDNGRTARLDVTSLADGTPDHLATLSSCTLYIDGVPDNAGC